MDYRIEICRTNVHTDLMTGTKRFEPADTPHEVDSLVYSYLHVLNKRLLLEVAHVCKVSVNARKHVLLSRLMLTYILRKHTADAAAMFDIRGRGLPSYDEFKCSFSMRSSLYVRFVSVEVLIESLPEVERQAWRSKLQTAGRELERGGITLNNSVVRNDVQEANEPFSLHVFARLIVVLRDDERARGAVIRATESDLSREELDGRVTRKSFWSFVADRFNYTSLRTSLNLTGRLDDVDAGRAVSTFRSAKKLRQIFVDARALFPIALDKWSRSG